MKSLYNGQAVPAEVEETQRGEMGEGIGERQELIRAQVQALQGSEPAEGIGQ